MSSFSLETTGHSTSPILELRSQINEDASKFLSDSDCERFLASNDESVAKAAAHVDNWWWASIKLYPWAFCLFLFVLVFSLLCGLLALVVIRTWYTSPLAGETEVTPANILSRKDSQEDVLKEFFPRTFYGVTKTGNPIFWEKQGVVSANFSKIKEDFTVDQLTNRHVRSQSLCSIMSAHQSAKLGKRVKYVAIVDAEGMSMIPDRLELQVMQAMIDIDQKYYPSVMETQIFINTPFIIWVPVLYYIITGTLEQFSN